MPETIAVIGLGNMGTPMSRRLLEAGHEVVGFDLDAAARDRLVAAGGRAAASPREAVAGAGLVILMLPNSTVVESVLDEEFVAALDANALVLDMSSSEPMRTRALAERLAASGVDLIDAPVSGGVRGAEAGTLTIMVGGSPELAERATAVLTVLGRPVHAGPVGAGHAAKALNNLLSATHLWATGEAMTAGERFGIAPETLPALINGSRGRSGPTENKWPNFILTGRYDSGFAAGLMFKDMRIATDLAHTLGTPTTLSDAAVAAWEQAVADLGAAADHTAVARWISGEEGGAMAR